MNEWEWWWWWVRKLINAENLSSFLLFPWNIFFVNLIFSGFPVDCLFLFFCLLSSFFISYITQSLGYRSKCFNWAFHKQYYYQCLAVSCEFYPQKAIICHFVAMTSLAINVGVAISSTGGRLGTLQTLAVHWTSPQSSDISDPKCLSLLFCKRIKCFWGIEKNNEFKEM